MKVKKCKIHTYNAKQNHISLKIAKFKNLTHLILNFKPEIPLKIFLADF